MFIVLSLVLLGSLCFAGGWFANTKFASQLDKQVLKTANDFVLNIQSGETDKAYAVTDSAYKSLISKDEFNKKTASINGIILLDSTSNLYKNGNMFLYVKELTNNDDKTSKVIVVNMYKNNNKVEVSGVSL